MLKIGICDDNLKVLDVTSKILESVLIENDIDADITLVTSEQNKILEEIKSKNIDILFLDVDFKDSGKNGIEFANELRKYNKDFYLIFISAFQKYIQISLSVKVFDYLIKPINKDTITELMLRLDEDAKFSNNIFLQLNKWKKVRLDKILYIEKQNNKAIVVTTDGIQTSNKTLGTLLNELPKNFVKAHRSYIVNYNNIVSIDKKLGLVYFLDNKSCPINSSFNI